MAILKALPGSAKINGKPVKGKLSQIKISVINIEKFLLERKEQTKKQNENFVKQNQNFKRLQKEEKLEKPKNQWKKLVPKKIPGLSFFDSIKKFVSGWILGFIAIKLIPLLPKLIPIVVNLGKFVNFVIDIGGKFLSGFISFIDFGVKAGEATFGFLKNIGGEDFAKSFARFGGLLATVLDLMLLVGGMTLMERLAGNDGGGGLFDLFGRGKRKPPANNIRPFSRVKPPTGGRFGRSALTNLGRKGIVRVLGRQGSKQFLKLTKSFISPIVKRIPLVGALADFALNVFVFGESPGKSAFKAIGAGLGAWLLGAVGSIFPGVGTIIGAIAGGIAGDMLGGVIYDMIFDEKDPKKRDEEKKKKNQKNISGSIVTGGTSGVLQSARKSSVRKGASKLAKTTGKTLSQRATKIATNVGKKRIESKAVKAIKSAPKIAKKVVQKIPKAFTKPVTKALSTAGKTGVKALTTAGKTGVKALTTAGKTGVKALTTAGKTGVKAISGTLKAAKRIISPIVKKIPFIGPIVDFLLNAFVFKEPLGKSAFMAIGAGLGGSIGAMLGTLIPVPGVGTAIGAFVGGAGGDILGGMIYDAIFGGKAAEGKQKNKEKKVIKTKIKSKVTGRFDMKTGKAYINDQEVALDEYEKFANMSMQEKIDQYGSGRSPSQSITPPQPKLGKQTPRFNDQLLSVSASYETDGGQKEYTIYAPTTQINMLPGDNSNQLVTSGATVSSGDDPYEILEKGN